MPDRLAPELVMLVMEVLADHHVLRTAALDDDAAITNFNDATDSAIEGVERLLRQD